MAQNQFLQKFLAIVILVLIPLFVIKEYKHITLSKHLLMHADGKLVNNEYTAGEDKSFVIFVFASEQEEYCDKTLESIFSQSYPSFRVVYLDEGESSRNYTKAEKFIFANGYEKKITMLKSSKPNELFEKFYQALHEAKDSEVIIHLAGSDWFASDQILHLLNDTYKDPDVWLSYGEYMEYPSLKKQALAPTVNSILRDFRPEKTPWMRSHVKTYYAGLLKQMTPTSDGLRNQALSKEDRFLMLSLLKVGKWHVKFIPEVLAIYDSQTQKNI